MVSESSPCPPSRTLYATRSIATSGDGSHRYSKVIRHPSALHRLSRDKYDRPESVLSSPKLALSAISSCIRSSILRPAAKAACSGRSRESARANSSAFRNSTRPGNFGKSIRAAVVLPAPFAPPRITISFTSNPLTPAAIPSSLFRPPGRGFQPSAEAARRQCASNSCRLPRPPRVPRLSFPEA